MKKMAQMLAFFATLTLTLRLQATPEQENMPMIASRGQLMAYVVGQRAAHVAISVTSILPLGNHAFASVDVKSPSANAINEAVDRAYLAMSVAVKTDALTLVVYVYDADWNMILLGWKPIKLIPVPNGKFTLPPDYGRLELRLLDYVPLKINGAISGAIAQLDDDGSTRTTQQLATYNETVFFPVSAAGNNALLEVTTSSPYPKGEQTTDFWKAWNGEAVDMANFNLKLSLSYEDMILVKDQSRLRLNIVTTNRVAWNKVVEFTSTKRQQFEFSCGATDSLIGVNDGVFGFRGDYHYFIGAMILNASTGEWSEQTDIAELVGGNAIVVDLDPGTYYFFPIFEEGVLIEPVREWGPVSGK